MAPRLYTSTAQVQHEVIIPTEERTVYRSLFLDTLGEAAKSVGARNHRPLQTAAGSELCQQASMPESLPPSLPPVQGQAARPGGLRRAWQPHHCRQAAGMLGCMRARSDG
jgi:hypothetical protein